MPCVPTEEYVPCENPLAYSFAAHTLVEITVFDVVPQIVETYCKVPDFGVPQTVHVPCAPSEEYVP